MFYDLNIPWSADDNHLPRTLAFCHELGYNVVALNHTISGKLPGDLTCPIPDPLPSTLPTNLRILRRCTLVLTASHQNARLADLARAYDILAVRPVDERTLALACGSLDCDIVSLDLSQRLPFWFRHKMLAEAVKGGKRIEVCYAQGVAGAGDPAARRNLIANVTQLVRASRGRGLVWSSGAKRAVELRGPWDVVNLAAVWGLGRERGYEGLSKEARAVVVAAQLKRTSYRGAVDVVYGGEKRVEGQEEVVNGASGLKRKADVMNDGTAGIGKQALSKRQIKKQARSAAATIVNDGNG